MAELRRSLTGLLVVALAAPALLGAGAASAQGAGGYGPYAPAPRGEARGPGPGGREPYCGARAALTTPDIMTYDRATGSEVMVGAGPQAGTTVTGVNHETGTTFSVHGDLAGPETTSLCTANGVTGSAYAIRGEGPGTVVNGVDGQTGRRFEVAQGPGGQGPDFKSSDPRTGRSTEVITPPDGRPIVREFGKHALECTRARLGLGVGIHAEIGDHQIGGDTKGGVGLHFGDC